MSIFQIISDDLKAGRTGILATVIGRTGSAPRDIGARMYMDREGRSHGTVGGGLLELEIQKTMGAMQNETRASVFHMAMNAKTVADEGMICGGNVDVLLEPVVERHRDLYSRLAGIERTPGEAVIVTSLGDVFTKTLVEADLGITGDPVDEGSAGEYMRLAAQKKPCMTEDGAFFIEPVFSRAPLYIFGAGHVSQYIAKIAAMVDFSVVVIDDREEFANAGRFPEADRILTGSFADSFASLEFTGNEYVVIVTRGHSHDAEVLKAALSRPARYTGMIGSRRKVAMIFDLMKQSGFSDDAINRVYAPIGLDIAAETPQEIAVSIVAQLIEVRAR